MYCFRYALQPWTADYLTSERAFKELWQHEWACTCGRECSCCYENAVIAKRFFFFFFSFRVQIWVFPNLLLSPGKDYHKSQMWCSRLLKYLAIRTWKVTKKLVSACPSAEVWGVDVRVRRWVTIRLWVCVGCWTLWRIKMLTKPTTVAYKTQGVQQGV